MNGPTIVPCLVMQGLHRRGLVVDPFHHLELLALEGRPRSGIPVRIFEAMKNVVLPGIAVRGLHHQVGAQSPAAGGPAR